MKPFILNVNAKVVHRVIVEDGKRFSLEQCQIDQIKKKRYSDTAPKSYAPCAHCMVIAPEVVTLRQVPRIDEATFAP